MSKRLEIIGAPKACEEMGELLTALGKFTYVIDKVSSAKRIADIEDEMADVMATMSLMVEANPGMFDRDKIEARAQKKLAKFLDRVVNGEGMAAL